METLKKQFDKDRENLISKIKESVAYFEIRTGTFVRDINIDILTHKRLNTIDSAAITNISVVTSMDDKQYSIDI